MQATLPERGKKPIPLEFQVHFEKGNRLAASNPDEAEKHYETACKLCPEIWLGIACEELKAGNRQLAATRLEQVMRHTTEPKTLSVALCNFGMILNNNGDRRGSEPYFRKSLNLWKRADTATNLALCRLYDHDLEDANRWIDAAIRMEPANHTVWFNKALITLISGDLKKGFREYESRWKNPQSKTKKLPVMRPEWNGEPLEGKTLLVYAEQGAGDTIQMLRYGPILKRMGCKPLLAPQPGIGALAARQGCWDAIYEDILDRINHGNVPAYDYQIPALNLPRVFGTTLETIPPAPYLEAGKTFQVEHSGNLRIGFSWAGSVDHAHDLWRSTHLADWLPLFEIPGIDWYSFQLGPRTVEFIGRDNLPVSDLSDRIKTYDNSASFVDSMDLIISVDTSLVHLAGALGKECWVLLPSAPDWRWMLHRDDSPWYPSIKLIRQKQELNWGEAFERLKSELISKVSKTRQHATGYESPPESAIHKPSKTP